MRKPALTIILAICSIVILSHVTLSAPQDVDTKIKCDHVWSSLGRMRVFNSLEKAVFSLYHYECPNLINRNIALDGGMRGVVTQEQATNLVLSVTRYYGLHDPEISFYNETDFYWKTKKYDGYYMSSSYTISLMSYDHSKIVAVRVIMHEVAHLIQDKCGHGKVTHDSIWFSWLRKLYLEKFAAPYILASTHDIDKKITWHADRYEVDLVEPEEIRNNCV